MTFTSCTIQASGRLSLRYQCDASRLRSALVDRLRKLLTDRSAVFTAPVPMERLECACLTWQPRRPQTYLAELLVDGRVASTMLLIDRVGPVDDADLKDFEQYLLLASFGSCRLDLIEQFETVFTPLVVSVMWRGSAATRRRLPDMAELQDCLAAALFTEHGDAVPVLSQDKQVHRRMLSLFTRESLFAPWNRTSEGSE